MCIFHTLEKNYLKNGEFKPFNRAFDKNVFDVGNVDTIIVFRNPFRCRTCEHFQDEVIYFYDQ